MRSYGAVAGYFFTSRFTIPLQSVFPNQPSTSGISAGNSLRYRSDKQPITYSESISPRDFRSAYSRIVFTDSSFASPMKPQVLTTTISPGDVCSGSCCGSIPASASNFIKRSESTRFLEHPSEMTSTFFRFINPDRTMPSQIHPCGTPANPQSFHPARYIAPEC